MKGIHKIFNDILSVVTILLGIYLISSPFVPEILYRINPPTVTDIVPIPTLPSTENDIPLYDIPNTLEIPKIGIQTTVIDSENSNSLNQGIWKLPYSSTPDKGGNTVMVGHRFQYTTGPNTFYLLDKLSIGDEISVYWNKIKYRYSVSHISIVEPTQLEIEAATDYPILTLYTCTPLWTAKNRLVVVATPIL